MKENNTKKNGGKKARMAEEFPAQVVKGVLAEGEKLLETRSSDMLCSGVFGEAYLVLTDRRLISFGSRENPHEVVLEMPLEEVSSLERRDLRGCCRLEAHSITGFTVVAFYTRSLQDSFEKLLQAAKPHIKQQIEEEQSEEDAEHREHKSRGPGWGEGHGAPKVCETCGKPIPHRIGVCPDCLDRKKLYVRLLALARPYAGPMSIGLGLMLLITGVEMAQPVLTKVLIDNVIPNSDLRLFVWIVVAIACIHSFSAVFSGVRGYLMGWLGERITHDLRREVYGHVQTLSLDFYDQRQTGWIMDRVSADTANLQHFLSEGFQDLIRDIMTILVILSIMLAMSWSLALVTLVPAPIVVFLTHRFMGRMHRVWHAAWGKRARMTAHLSNVIPGVRVVKAFAQESRERERFTQRSADYMKAHVRAARSFAVFHPTIHLAISLGFVLVWSYGGYQVIAGKGVTLGTLVAFISFLWRFYGPLSSLTRFSHRAQRALTSAQRVFDVLDTEPSVKNPDDLKDMASIAGDVEFRDVTFGYEPDEPVLKNVTFSVNRGEMIGLVGPSGAGKSTTINLLSRFYDVNEGAILIDGVDIRDVTMGSIHRQIGIVLQEPFLFHGTIGENIAYGNPGARHKDIIAASKAANAHEFIMKFPDGYDTLAGERGQRLSGGERQRISIARAILKDPRILILDEATSSIDTETEATIQEAIARLVEGRTTFAIAHRFSTLRNADRLVVLEEGKIVEIGSHEELLAKEDGVFKRLVDIQVKNNQIVAVGG